MTSANDLRVTVDTHTGKPFRWNGTCVVVGDDGTRVCVPEFVTSRSAEHLHPSRVPAELLLELNHPAALTSAN